MKRFLFLFLIRTDPGAQLWLWSQLCMWATLRHLFPTQAGGGESNSWLGHPYLLRPGRDKAAIAGTCAKCLQQQRPAGICNRWNMLCALPGTLAPDCGTLSSGRPRRPLGRWGQWSVLTHGTLGGSGGSSNGLRPPLGSEIVVAAHARPWNSCRWCPVACEHTEKEAPMVGPPLSLPTSHQWSLASLAGPGFFLDSLSCDALHPISLRLSSRSQSRSSPQHLISKAQASVPSPNLPQWVRGQVS